MSNKENEETTSADMQRLFDYMDKMDVEYTVNTNPSPEEIERIRGIIKRNEEILGITK